MKTIIVSILLMAISGSSNAYADSGSVELAPRTAKLIGNLLRKAEQSGNKDVSFEGGPNVTIYSAGGITCYFQNADDSVSCSASSDEPQ